MKETLTRPLFYLFFLALVSVSCTSSTDLEMRRGDKALKEGRYEQAVLHFKRVMSVVPNQPTGLEAAQKAAEASFFELKDFKKALVFYKHIVIHSSDQNKMVEAQKKVAEIVFQHLADHEQSVREYFRLLELPHSKEEELEYRLALARAYFFLSNFFQAEVEIEQILKDRPRKDPKNFDALLLKANIKVATKDLDGSISAFKELKELFPERSRKEQIYLNLAMSYEEIKDFDNAIATLEDAMEHYPTPEFIRLRIERLRTRKDLQPGAQGLKR